MRNLDQNKTRKALTVFLWEELYTFSCHITVSVLSSASGLPTAPREVIQYIRADAGGGSGVMAGTVQWLLFPTLGFPEHPEFCFRTCMCMNLIRSNSTPWLCLTHWCSSNHLPDPLPALSVLAEAGTGDVEPSSSGPRGEWWSLLHEMCMYI